jgi:hypothetical protein
LTSFSVTLRQYYEKPTLLLFQEVQNCLWSEFWTSLKGIKTLRCNKTSQKFYFSYALRAKSNDELPEKVSWNGEEKDFSEALLALFEDLSEKTKKRKDLKALFLSAEDRTRWIRSSLSLVLNNKVFHQSIARYQKQKRKVIDSIIHEATLSNSDFSIFEQLTIDSKGYRFYEICKQQIGHDLICNWYGKFVSVMAQRSQAKKPKIKNLTRSLLDVPSKMAKLFVSETNLSHKENFWLQEQNDFEESTIVSQENLYVKEKYLKFSSLSIKQRDQIDNHLSRQHAAFFWRPGLPLHGYRVKDIGHLRPIYIAFFYSWLRSNSKAKKSEIADEIGVSVSAVTRDWLPDRILKDSFNKGNYSIDDGVYPVIFSPNALKQLGLFNRKVRCYNKMIFQGDEYNEILSRKQSLWTVYSLMLEPDLADMIFDKSSRLLGTKKKPFYKFNFDFNIASAEEIGVGKDPKELYIYVHSFRPFEKKYFHSEFKNAHNIISNTLTNVTGNDLS